MGIAKFFGRRIAEGNSEKKTNPPSVMKAVPAEPDSVIGPVAFQPRVAEGGIPEEIIAVIAAAVSTFYSAQGASQGYTIRKIQRAGGGRSLWGTAGLLEGTRPF